MKVSFHNLGVVGEAEIDLKPLTVFVGPNNSGKTWIAYTLAGIFGSYGFREYLRAYLEGEVPEIYRPIDQAAQQVLSNGSATIDLVQFAQEYGKNYFNSIALFAKRWMPKFMSTNVASFERLDISIDLAETEKDLIERIWNYTLRLEIPPQKPFFNIRKKRGDRKLYIYTSAEQTSPESTPVEEQIADRLPPDVIKESLTNSVLLAIHRSLYPRVYTLPTERTTFITFPFRNREAGWDSFRVKQRTLTSQRQGFRTMIEPVNYFLTMINDIAAFESEGKEQRAKEAESNPKIKEYLRLAELMEKQILSGEVKFSQLQSDLSQELSQSKLSLPREVLFQPTQDTSLEISIASSMVKELTPLILYLRYLAKPRELLIIDEPEMNLHPEAQAKMIEFLSMLINAGLNVILTTHSPYVLDHLSNLIKAAEAEDREGIRCDFFLQRTDAFISKNKVSVYLFDQQGHTTNAMDEDGVIQLNTFGEVSDRISEIYFKL